MVAAPGAAQPRLASAALRWPGRGPAASPALRSAPTPRAPPGDWSHDCWRCTAANKPALAGLGEIKNKTNKLAKRPGSWGGAWAAGPWVLVPARRWRARCGFEAQTSRSSPGKPRRCTRGPRRLLAARCAPRWRSCFPRTAGSWGTEAKSERLHAAGLSPAAPTSCTAEEAGKFWLRGWEPPCLGALAGTGQWLAHP